MVARCQTWIVEHYCETAPVAAMARLSGLSERSFKRRFRQATGMSPLEEDAGFFARLFRRNVTLTPAQYRRRFRGLRRTLQSAQGPQTRA